MRLRKRIALVEGMAAILSLLFSDVGGGVHFAQAVAAEPGAGLRVATPEALRSACASAHPGDRIVMTNGEWRDADLRFTGQGEADKPITLVAETPGRVILTGHSRLQIDGAFLVVEGLWFKGGALTSGSVVEFRGHEGAHDCRLTGCVITDYNPPSDRTQYKWVSLYGTRNRVDHCYFRGQAHEGQTLVVWVGDAPNDHRIDHNYFAGRPPLGRNGGETIRIGTSTVSMHVSRTVVDHNLFEHCDGELEIISNKSIGNVYRDNTFRASKGTLTLRHGNRCVVEGNFFFGDGVQKSGGVRVIGEDHRVINNYFEGLTGTGPSSALTLVEGIPNSPLAGYFQVKRALIAFNTFVNCRQVFEIGNGKGKSRSLPPEDVTIANNLATNTGERPLVNEVDTPVRATWTGNLFWGGKTGIDVGEGISLVDPKLLQKDGLFRPGEMSPAIDSATGNYVDVISDIDGQPRIGKKDVGCDEWSDAPVHNRPLTSKDVGPDWMK